jgi:hypothetical protein
MAEEPESGTRLTAVEIHDNILRRTEGPADRDEKVDFGAWELPVSI